uniref:IlGF domain-containing protein n=1 Tax=Parastrongyloides trichosuri TaxID=131310 RepID=A0A0N4ZCG3_PARTI
MVNGNYKMALKKRFFFKTIVCLFVLALIFQASEGSVRLCGYRLSKMLTTICKTHNCAKDAEYESHLEVEKKDHNPEEIYRDESPSFMSEVIGIKENKRSGGVVNDCCINRCSLSHLKTYCCGYVDEEVDF